MLTLHLVLGVGANVMSGRVWTAVLVTVAFALLARLIRGVSASGALAGAAVAFLLYLSTGLGGFVALVSVFLLAWFTTRLGYTRKESRGIAEKKGGRTAHQVGANLGVAAGCAVLSGITGNLVFMVALAAALAEAAADTVSSECGQIASDKAMLITTWEEVPSGTDGGITLAGTLAGTTAACLVSLVCVVTRLMPRRLFWISTAAATLGMLADSFLGAWLERRGILNNDAVNFLSTVLAVIIAVLLFRFQG